MKKEIALRWNEANARWDMYYRGAFIMEFPDCENLRKFFKPYKEIENHYQLTIERLAK